MTSKLKCPVCNHELYQTASECLTYCCLNKDCPSDFKFAGSKEIWQALIQAKQDLEIVVDALKPFADRDNWDFEHCFIDGPQLLAGEALEQINHK